MKSKKSVIITAVLAASMIAGSSLTVLAAESTVSVSDNPSVSQSQSQDTEKKSVSSTDSSKTTDESSSSAGKKTRPANSTNEENSTKLRKGHRKQKSASQETDGSQTDIKTRREKIQSIDGVNSGADSSADNGSAEKKAFRKGKGLRKSKTVSQGESGSTEDKSVVKKSDNSTQTPSGAAE